MVHWKGVTKKVFTPYKEHLLEKYGSGDDGIKTIEKIPNRILITDSQCQWQRCVGTEAHPDLGTARDFGEACESQTSDQHWTVVVTRDCATLGNTATLALREIDVRHGQWSEAEAVTMHLQHVNPDKPQEQKTHPI